MSVAACIVFFIGVFGLALSCALDDYHAIREGEAIDHPVQWVQRAVFGIALSAACAALIGVAADAFSWTLFTGFLLMSAGGFSATFRWKLNGLRKEWWWYMGAPLGRRKMDASVYDTMFHRFAWTVSGKNTYEDWPEYPYWLPALLAYLVEVVMFVAGLILIVT